MSYFPEESMGFFETIQVYFMELTGRALIFSGRDLQLLVSWRAQGATARMVCQGVKDAVRAMCVQEPPRDIYTCRNYIEPLIERTRHLHGASKCCAGHEAATNSLATQPAERTPDLVDDVLSKIEQVGRGCDDDSLKNIYREAWKRVKELRHQDSNGDALYEHLLAIEDAFIDSVYGMLDEQKKQHIEQQIQKECTPFVARMSESARQQHLCARRRLLVKRGNFGVRSLLD